MPEDILSDLKAKEDELDALVESARLKAASIKDGARRKAGDIKASHASSIEAELEGLRRAHEKATAEEVEKIERASDCAVEELRALCAKNMGRAVSDVTRLINGEDGSGQ